jgi:basic membrane lipoprotein Med (substrate-binding protein (PBP1-ABC) superfamily)
MSYEEYQAAKRLGEKALRKAEAEHRNPYPDSLDELLEGKRTAGEVRIGTLDIPLHMVNGTVTKSRQNSFSYNFMPIMDVSTEFAQKWSNLYDSQVDEGLRDPIMVYEYLHAFYVQEGNKRVSVMKYLEVPSIQAEVTRVMPAEEDCPEIYREFLAFYRVAPFYDIVFTKPGSYQRFASLLGRNLEDAWPADLINTVRGAYYRFSMVYETMSSADMTITTGDAFLLYLLIYQFDSLLDVRREVIGERIRRIWNEILVENSSDPISLRESPESGKPSAGFFSGLLRGPAYTEKHPLKAAFLYEGSLEESGWSSDHDVGRIYLEKYFHGVVSTWFYERCDSDESRSAAVKDAVERGAQVIFMTSPAQVRAALREAIRYPEVRFCTCSVYQPHSAVHTYYAREYEVKFLMGALAAVHAENHRIGYLAKDPTYGNVAGINAFAIGAGMIDPEARIMLAWSCLGSDWHEEFHQKDTQVYAGPDLSFEGWDQPSYGLCQRMADGRIRSLAAPVRNWGRFYERMIQSVLNGSAEIDARARKESALNEWWGISAGVIDINLSSGISYYARKMIDLFRSGLIAGTLDPFRGELHSQEGLIQGPDAPRLSGEQIVTMNWLNDNVIGSIPAASELKGQAREDLEESDMTAGALK